MDAALGSPPHQSAHVGRLDIERPEEAARFAYGSEFIRDDLHQYFLARRSRDSPRLPESHLTCSLQP